MIKPRLFLCGGTTVPDSSPLRDGRHVVQSSIYGRDSDVNVCVEDVAKVFPSHLSSRLRDLLDLAAYVYTVDCSAKRGGQWGEKETIEPWGRDFSLVVPVRDLDFWQDEKVSSLLRKILNFLSDDKWGLEFQSFTPSRDTQLEFTFSGETNWPFQEIDRISMFSGGLDSLAGAVERASRGDNLVLVSHRPVTTQDARQRRLFKSLADKVSVSAIRIPVWVNKNGKYGREHTQRTRSFLFSVLGTLVGESMEAGGVSFYENGVVSLNLPVADEVVGARASRTTHPLAIHLFQELAQLILEREFVIDNPFLLNTKKDVVSLIADAGYADLIGQTCSCAHQGHFPSNSQYHCGTCSQCIDRRMAILAAGLADYDPATDYQVDVFKGPRHEGYERNIAVDYVRHAMELNQLDSTEIATRFNAELSRAIRPFPNRTTVAEKLVELHRRHGQVVSKVVSEQIQVNSLDLINCKLEPTSLISLVAGQEHRTSRWRAYAERIARVLQEGIPRAYQSTKPKNELELQEKSDALLHAAGEILEREFPFAMWASVRTKPDWSDERKGLWVELKYVRKRQGFTRISEDIAADVTKYGESGRRVLYVIYDPEHCVVDDTEFIAQIEQHPGMMVRFIR